MKEAIEMIAEKIKNARLQSNYTQEQTAEKLMVSRQTISNWENGKSLPDILSLIRMSEFFHLSLDDLLKGDQLLMKKIEKDVMAVNANKKIIKFGWLSVILGIIMLVLGNLFKGNPLIDFINGALPWVLLGLMLLFAFLYLNKEEKE